MINRLSERDIRIVKIGAVCAAAILALTFGTKWVERWRQVRESLSQVRSKLNDIALDDAKQASLLSIVPVFEMPQVEEKQKYLLRDKFNEQLKKAGIESEPLQILPARKSKQAGSYKVLLLKCRGKCRFEQVLDLLAGLKENPYLVGVEELKIQCDAKQPPDKRQEVVLDMTVSTFIK